MTKGASSITIASASQPVHESLDTLCRGLGLTPSEASTLWLVDGHHPVGLNAIPKDAKIIVLGPIPSNITPAHTIPAPSSLNAIREVLVGYLDSQSTRLRNGWSFDYQQRSITHADKTINLTEKEAALLHALLQHMSQEISREALLKQIWSYDKEVDTHTLETHIYRLRQKAGPDAFDITTTEHGYKVVL